MGKGVAGQVLAACKITEADLNIDVQGGQYHKVLHTAIAQDVLHPWAAEAAACRAAQGFALQACCQPI